MQYWRSIFWGSSSALTSFCREACGVRLSGDLWDRAKAWKQWTQNGGWCYPHRDFLMVCEFPREIHHERVDAGAWPGRYGLHRNGGPALSWSDGWGHAIHGVGVPGWMIEHPERLTVEDIEREANAEVWRVMLDRYGWSRYMIDSGAAIIDEMPPGHEIAGLRGARLLRKLLPGEREPSVYLDVLNSTPEPDGTVRRYLERIDPNAYDGDAGRLRQAAMASRCWYRDDAGERRRTCERWQDYRPQAES